jgi:threonine/homoserine/homoserine lactone efflux protein
MITFVAIAALVTITPGVDMALVMRNSLRGGMRAALATSLGIITGLLVWMFASAVGIASLLRASAEAFTVLKIVGAGYLVFLGVQTILQTRRGVRPPEERVRRSSPYRQGLLSNLLNPKVAVFYATFLPQFISAGDPVFAKTLLLGSIHLTMGLVWLPLYAYAVVRAGAALRRPSVMRAAERLTGTVLVALGVRLAFARR